MLIIVHAVPKAFWSQNKNTDFYGEDFIRKQGFIHCSTFDTILEVANSNFTHFGQMVLLCIDADRVSADIKWEDLRNCGVVFPHIYGLLNTNAIIDVFDFNKNSSNEFYLPNEISKYRI